MKACWPEVEEVDDLLLKESEYLTEVSHDFRVRLKKMLGLREKVSELFHQVPKSFSTCYSFCNRKVGRPSSLDLNMGSSMWQMVILVGKL